MKKHLLAMTFWSFQDALIQTYTLPYLKIIAKKLPKGSIIYLMTLEKPTIKLSESQLKTVNDSLKNHAIVVKPYPYYPFGLKAMLVWLFILSDLFVLIVSKNIKFIHAFCTPAGLGGYLLSVLTRRKLILDSYEPHAEASVENGDWQRNSFRFKFLFWFERQMSRRASVVIAAAQGMKKYAKKKYGVSFANFYVKPACVDTNAFSDKNLKKPALLEALGLENKIVAVYAGKFGGIYLDQEVFDFLKVCQTYWKDHFRVLLLTNHPAEQLNKWAAASGFDMAAAVIKFVPHAQIADYMGLADFALTPVKPIPTKRYCTPIKDGEYWALGLPVVISANISDDSHIIEKHQIGAVIHHFDPLEYTKAVQKIDAFLNQYAPQARYEKIHALAVLYRSFAIADHIYEQIYGAK